MPRRARVVTAADGGRAIAGRIVAPIGFGPMRLSIDLPPRADAIRTIVAALDAGATLIDTADCYGPTDQPHHNEALTAEALAQWRGRRDDIVLATKSGHRVTADGGFTRHGRPELLRAACERSLRALRVERIDLYQLHGPDPAVPFEDQIGAFARLRDEGKIAAVGLCNVGRKQISAARGIVPIASIQNRYSAWARGAESVLGYCTTEGLAFLAWSPLGARGDLTPVPALARIAAAHGVSWQRVALAWLLARSPALIPLVGATRPETARDSLAATALALGEAELAAIDADLPVAQLPELAASDTRPA